MSDLFFCVDYNGENKEEKGKREMRYCHVRNQCLNIRLPKEIDHYQAEKIREECELMFLKAPVRDIIFDFSQTVFMDSSGIGLILGRIQQTGPLDGIVYLFGGNPSIQKMWAMSGLNGKVKILNTIEEVKEVYE